MHAWWLATSFITGKIPPMLYRWEPRWSLYLVNCSSWMKSRSLTTSTMPSKRLLPPATSFIMLYMVLKSLSFTVISTCSASPIKDSLLQRHLLPATVPELKCFVFALTRSVLYTYKSVVKSPQWTGVSLYVSSEYGINIAACFYVHPFLLASYLLCSLHIINILLRISTVLWVN